eukprot:TRINITY_DN8493_c0_g1_i3.p1 TRINITY_DN8493_c0_g1~~TRINITY_DN8493_c0_g1_i3.p1  ORF type:complete len:370 (+),score=73.01 TRINITY_DN8493_c0_g1_i3:110-1219(+)
MLHVLTRNVIQTRQRLLVSRGFTDGPAPLVVIDGTAAIISACRAIKKELTTSDGRRTTAAYGLLSSVIKLKKQHRYSPFLVVLERAAPPDREPVRLSTVSNSLLEEPLNTLLSAYNIEPFPLPLPILHRNRRTAFSDYKANRSTSNASWTLDEVVLAADIVSLLGVSVLKLQPDVEADDAIGSICAWRRHVGRETIVVGNDADYLQLRSNVTQVHLPHDHTALKAVPASKLAVYRALVGDATDNIPGVKGIGHRRAKRMLEHFSSLDDLLAATEKDFICKGLTQQLHASIQPQHAEAKLSFALQDLTYPSQHITDVEDHGYTFDMVMDLDHQLSINYDVIKELLKHLEFKRLEKQLFENNAIQLFTPSN